MRKGPRQTVQGLQALSCPGDSRAAKHPYPSSAQRVLRGTLSRIMPRNLNRERMSEKNGSQPSPFDGTSQSASESSAVSMGQTSHAGPSPESAVLPSDRAGEDEPLFTATYDTTLELLTHYTSLLVGARQRTFALVMAFVDLALAAVVGALAPAAWPLSVVLLGIGFGMLWYRGNAARLSAQRVMQWLDPADLHRTVRVYADRVELERAGGQVYSYPARDLTQVEADDKLVVLAFGRDGVTVPAEALEGGAVADLAAWAERVRPETIGHPKQDGPASPVR